MLDLHAMFDIYLEEELILQAMGNRPHNAEQRRRRAVREERKARALFSRGLRRARLAGLVARLLKRRRSLHHWADLELGARLLNGYYGGHKHVRLSAIVGSVSRPSDFDAGYYPKAEHLAPRWESVAMAMLAGEELPPVQLYKAGESYFVLDGNNRVSVAKLLGMQSIYAEVIEFVFSDDTPSEPRLAGQAQEKAA
jgi:hypothetical protein